MLHPTLCPSSSACTFGHRFQLDTHQHPVRILSVATLIPVGYPLGAVAVADSVTGGASLRFIGMDTEETPQVVVAETQNLTEARAKYALFILFFVLLSTSVVAQE